MEVGRLLTIFGTVTNDNINIRYFDLDKEFQIAFGLF